MLTFLGFAMVITFMYLIMTKRLSALIALILVPILFALFGGFSAKIGPMMLEGISKLAPTGVMLMFAILYFALMIDSGLFDPAVRKILKLVKGDPLKVSVGTAVLALVVSLDGDGATTYMICCAAMLPMYSRLGMSPRIMAGLIILAGGVMNMTPWGGPTARAASALHVDPSDIFVPMIPAMLFGVLAILAIAYMYGKRERARLGELHLPTDDIDHSEITVSQYPDARRPKLLYFNGALTAALMVALIAGLLPLPVLFMIAFSIAMIVNYPCLQQQKDRIAARMRQRTGRDRADLRRRHLHRHPVRHRHGRRHVQEPAGGHPRGAGPIPGRDHRDREHAVHVLHVQRCILLRRAAGAGRSRQPLWHHPGGNGPCVDRRAAGTPAQPAGTLHLPAGSPGRYRVRRSSALHAQVGSAGMPVHNARRTADGDFPAVQ